MPLLDVLRVGYKIWKLSRQNSEWKDVYAMYLTCVKLILILAILRGVVDILFVVTLAFAFLQLIYYPMMVHHITFSGIYRWIYTSSIFSIVRERLLLS